MESLPEDFSTCTALVADGNANSRAVIVAQLRALGIHQIFQCIRPADARRRLEVQDFDFVLCEMYFPEDDTTGQELLDDLRRNHLLPFATVFVMITGEATYVKVAEAAESALDGYVLKPHKAAHLEERLMVARARKRSLQPVFDAIGNQDFERATTLCTERFHQRGHFWLYAGRVGAELLMRLGRYAQAQALYQIMLETEPLPWARLGIARTHLERGELTQACSSVEALLQDEPDYAEANDLLGRAQFERGQLELALATYVHATELTPSSISRVQSAGMLYFYCGQPRQAEPLLERAVRLGLESKMFDPQSLALLGLTRLARDDRRGLQRCLDDFAHLMGREPENSRLQRLAHFLTVGTLLLTGDAESTHAAVAGLAVDIKGSEFDFESAANLIALLAQMRSRQIYFREAEDVIHSVALRYCSHRTRTEMLCACAQDHAPYQDWIRKAHQQIQSHTEAALMLAHQGQIVAAIEALADHAEDCLNVRLIDNAVQLLHKYAAALPEHAALSERVHNLKQRAGAGNRRLTLGRSGRQPGGMLLRSGARAKAAPLSRVAPVSTQLPPSYPFDGGATDGRV